MCTNPKIAWKKKYASLKEPAKIYYMNKKIKFKQPKDYWNYDTIKISCGECKECQLSRANDWATRIIMESKGHKDNCFITLTYNPENLPINKNGKMTLNEKDMTNFIKKLRYYINTKILYFYCGEYGNNTHRPHYHILIMGWQPDDAKIIGISKTKKTMYTSEKLNKIWNKGYITVEELNYKTASYVARYTLKKTGIKKQKKEYTGEIEIIEKIDERNGQKYIDYRQKTKTNRLDKFGRIKEYIRMSKKPAIGLNYWNENKDKIKRNYGIIIKIEDKVYIKPIPRYFKKLWEKENPEEFLKADYKNKQNIELQKQNIVNKISLDKKYISKEIEFENKEKKLNEINEKNKNFKSKFLKRNQI